ncbi:hypothetical protein [Streptomyces poriferorum]|uniref:Nuclear transport factor 2 family protein n=1 Tax=Streptomyces poriferorum TaxID=2798799 RepID=A0ABY9IH53_9ACTN|nr:MULTISPECIES: hypothetical protein [unclassified Streptomyces]MDP5316098.1 hypothetical protein [Streptomyces sp. Alt4]WLQ54435.1 hypothetical protein P8A19_02800 [Streptomyces sp. Alt2]
MTDADPQDLADRYIAQWVVPEATARRAAIEQLWAEEGTHFLQPPVEIREIATGLGFDRSALQARGIDAFETRVARSHEQFVKEAGLTFRSGNDAVRLHDMVKFSWQTVSTGTGEVVGGGLEILILDEHDRIKADYMFPGA